MTGRNLFYCPCASFTNAQFPLLEVPELWFDELVPLVILVVVIVLVRRQTRTE